MYVLGIETSCDETSAAVVKDGKEILSNIVASSLEFHKKYGGVVPEIAFRKQLETISQVTDSAIKAAGIPLKKISLISVTNEPGLLGSLLVGISFARGLSLSRDLPLLEADHLYSHIYAGMFGLKKLPLPFVALVVSGGHTSLFYLRDFHRITPLAATQDDACGEAFDKTAKILGLGYPGGPLIERLAKNGDPKSIKFNCSGTKHPLNFSFSGIKTAVLYYVNGIKKRQSGKLYKRQTEDICATFQETVIDTLIQKSFLACKMRRSKRLVVGGGVAANNRLREKFNSAAKEKGISVYFASPRLCMDNAAMVAGLGYQLSRRDTPR
ncbi:MAG: tRNA (adenosine(37)-N6)-threonylcarbamoyltransferase complex transferase subunit TsaD [Candidatus Omnitrophica bacterium]|nr:tRNA (adenosine(37)-N6)-threonylcarbamoyltransferase complex transferase subunit TsaD [Candidatus Omnitrophota bacterium]